jgi:hypothetical protein
VIRGFLEDKHTMHLPYVPIVVGKLMRAIAHLKGGQCPRYAPLSPEDVIQRVSTGGACGFPYSGSKKEWLLKPENRESMIQFLLDGWRGHMALYTSSQKKEIRKFLEGLGDEQLTKAVHQISGGGIHDLALQTKLFGELFDDFVACGSARLIPSCVGASLFHGGADTLQRELRQCGVVVSGDFGVHNQKVGSADFVVGYRALRPYFSCSDEEFWTAARVSYSGVEVLLSGDVVDVGFKLQSGEFLTSFWSTVFVLAKLYAILAEADALTLDSGGKSGYFTDAVIQVYGDDFRLGFEGGLTTTPDDHVDHLSQAMTRLKLGPVEWSVTTDLSKAIFLSHEFRWNADAHQWVSCPQDLRKVFSSLMWAPSAVTPVRSRFAAQIVRCAGDAAMWRHVALCYEEWAEGADAPVTPDELTCDFICRQPREALLAEYHTWTWEGRAGVSDFTRLIGQQ